MKYDDVTQISIVALLVMIIRILFVGLVIEEECIDFAGKLIHSDAVRLRV